MLYVMSIMLFSRNLQLLWKKCAHLGPGMSSNPTEASPLWYCVSTLVVHPGGEDQPTNLYTYTTLLQESNNQENQRQQKVDGKLKTTSACVKKSEIWSHYPSVVPPYATNWLFDASMLARFQTASPKKIKHKLKKDHLAKKCAHQEGPTREFWTSESTRRFQGPNILLKCSSFECDCLVSLVKGYRFELESKPMLAGF